MSSIRRHAAAVFAAVFLVLAAGIGLGAALVPGSAAPARPVPQATRFLQRWQVNSAVLSAAGQYPPKLDLTAGGTVALTCNTGIPKTCNNPGTANWELGGPITVPTGQELVIDNVSFYYIGNGGIAGAGSGTGPGGPAGSVMWLAVGVPDQSGQPDVGMGADILMPLQAVNIGSGQVSVTGSEHGNWIVLPGDHLYLAGIVMGSFGSLLDEPPVVGFLSIFGHYQAIG